MIVANKKYYVIPSPQDADAFYSNVTTMTWDGFLNDVLVAFGVNKNRLEPLWTEPPSRSSINPKGKDLIHLTEDLYKRHLLPGRTYDILINRLSLSISNLLRPEQMGPRFGLCGTRSGAISLLDLCGGILIDATQMSLYDPILSRIDPDMTAGMQTFTDELWKLLYPSPGIDSSRVKSLRQKYMKAFLAYMRLPKEARRNEAWLITTLIDQYRELGINEDDAAAMMVMVYWTYVHLFPHVTCSLQDSSFCLQWRCKCIQTGFLGPILHPVLPVSLYRDSCRNCTGSAWWLFLN